MTNKICEINRICLTCSFPTNMSWQVQGHFCRIMRYYNYFDKQYSNKTKKYRIERLQDNFNKYKSVLKHNRVY
jgi:hypothetical protein